MGRRGVGIVLLLLMGGVLAGCVAPGAQNETASADEAPLSLPEFVAAKSEQVKLPMKDGALLDNWVFRPEGEGPFPVIIQSRPYFGNLDPPAAQGGQKFSKWLVDYFVPRGYAVVLHSIRGTGDSEGCYGQGGIVEQTDEAATVEAFAKMPWSSGKVAMVGKSYGGTTPWMAAVQKPAHLVTIVPVSGITFWYGYVANNGAVYAGGTEFEVTYPFTISFNVDPSTPPPSEAQLMNFPGKACEDVAMTIAEGPLVAATGNADAYWQERDYLKDVAKINEANVSVYIVHGLQDWNVKPDHVQDIYNKLTVPKRMLLGQMDHQYPLRADWGKDLLRWFDYWLKGIPNGILDTPPVTLQDSAGVWHHEQDFPPSRAVPLALHGDANGALAPDAGGKGSLAFLASVGGESLTWTTDEMPETHLSGTPTLTFNATLLGANAQLVATLYDVNGTTWKPIDWAHLDARHRAGPDKPADVTPGETLTYAMRFYPLDHHLAAGHKLGLRLAGEGGFIVTTAPPVQAQVETGPGFTLTLPTLPDLAVESPQPAMAKADDLPWTS